MENELTIEEKITKKYGTKRRECYFCSKKTHNPKYCSQSCSQSGRWKQIKEDVARDGAFNQSQPNRYVKRYFEEKNGTQCVLCKRKTWMGKPIPLEVDHTDGNSENNKIENLRMVCGNCGMQLPTYKGKNVGNGRHFRRQRYKEGKSY